MNNTNNFEVSIKITGFDYAEETGCSIQEISVTSKGEFGDKFAALCVSGLTKMTEIFTPPTPVKEIKSVETTDFKEVPTAPKQKVEHRTDINKVFECLEKVLPQHEGWTSDGYGNITFEKDDAKKASIALQKNKIEMHIYPETGSNLHIYLHKDHVNLDGVAQMFVQKWFNDHEEEFPGIENIFNVIQPFVENNAE